MQDSPYDVIEHNRTRKRHLVVPKDVLRQAAEDPGRHRTHCERERQREAPGTGRVDPRTDPRDLAREAPTDPHEERQIRHPGPEGTEPGRAGSYPSKDP